MWRVGRCRGGGGDRKGRAQSRTRRMFKLKLLLKLEGLQVGKNCHVSIAQIISLFNLAGGSISIILGL